jgi:DNA-directed RNA polymerase specialized sigma subunit
MPTAKPTDELAESTQRVYAMLQKADLNPRVKMALRMYAFGAVRTLTEAAEVCDLSVSYLSQKKNSPAGKLRWSRTTHHDDKMRTPRRS